MTISSANDDELGCSMGFKDMFLYWSEPLGDAAVARACPLARVRERHALVAANGGLLLSFASASRAVHGFAEGVCVGIVVAGVAFGSRVGMNRACQGDGEEGGAKGLGEHKPWSLISFGRGNPRRRKTLEMQ